MLVEHAIIASCGPTSMTWTTANDSVLLAELAPVLVAHVRKPPHVVPYSAINDAVPAVSDFDVVPPSGDEPHG